MELLELDIRCSPGTFLRQHEGIKLTDVLDPPESEF